MTTEKSGYAPHLFYSYCHEDSQHRGHMEKSLALLKRDGLLQQWSDLEILPGLSISSEIRNQMTRSEIMVFLLSPGFINSDECMKEWNYAKELSSEGKNLFRIPIIVRPCAWEDFLSEDDVMALPKDGRPVSQFEDADVAWKQVYEGIKAVVARLRNTFSPKEEFLQGIDKTDFLSQEHLNLQELFVFLRMTSVDPQANGQQLRDTTVTSRHELMDNKYVLIHGQEKSGKTALARHLYLSLIEEAQPVLLLDAKQIHGRVTEISLRNAYQEQFQGDFSLWNSRSNKTLIVDDLTPESRLPEFIESQKGRFDRIIMTLSSDVFYAFFKDEARLAEFVQMKIEPLTRVQQEELIRKRINLSQRNEPVSDGFVDQVEKRVDSVIISDRLLPRFPFYVLSILQTYEAYMPTNLSITSYGHCYHALIVANLIRSGISKTDDDVNACFNFAEHLAFRIHQHRENSPDSEFDFDTFITEYRNRFFIRESIINRLKSRPYGLIDDKGSFRTEFMYYYFLGKFLAGSGKVGRSIINEMCVDSHKEPNYLTLLFAIHHTTDSSIIDDILLRTMHTLESIPVATLQRDETRRFGKVITELPENIMSSESVPEARSRQREQRDALEEKKATIQDNEEKTPDEKNERLMDSESVNGIYKILKNNKIIGQVLRNRHGNLEKSTIEEIIQIIADSGLRLVNLVLADEKEIARWASYISRKHEDLKPDKVKNLLEFVSFVWAMVNIEQVVSTINVPEIREAIASVVKKNNTPAFDLIGYFSQLESATELKAAERDSLRQLLKDHDDMFVQRVLSIRTQSYMNTHRSKREIEQAVCALLKLRYRYRLQPSS